VWNGDDDDKLEDDISNTVPSQPLFNNPVKENIHALLIWMIGFLLTFQAKYYIPDTAINFLIKFLGAFICVAGRFCEVMKELADIFPSSLTTMLLLVKSAHAYTKFVVCQKCHSL
jgi:hypothetical protein